MNSSPVPSSTVSSQTSVIGVLDDSDQWKLYQVSINTGEGPGPGTTAPSDPSKTTGSSVVITALTSQLPVRTRETDDGPDDWSASPAIAASAAPVRSLRNLPDQSTVVVLDANHQWTVYRIPIDPKTAVLGLELLSKSGNLPIGTQMNLLDGSGHMLAGSVCSPDRQAISLDYTLDSATPASELYLTVTAPPESLVSPQSSGATSNEYVLHVTQQAVASQTPTPMPMPPNLPTPKDGGSSSSSPPGGLLASNPNAAAARPAPVSGAVFLIQKGSANPSSSPVASPPPVALRQEPQQVATGPLPEREGAALGGVLSQGDPAPQLDRHDSAMIDPALAGPSRSSPGVDGIERLTDADLEAILAEFDLTAEVAGALASVRGPGGFPILISALQGEPAADLGALAAVLPPGGTAIAPAITTDRATVPVETTASEPELRPRTLSRASAFSGLTVALALVFGLVLPDLTALLAIDEPRRFRLRPGFLRRLRCRAGV